jgi:hypothetical protein
MQARTIGEGMQLVEVYLNELHAFLDSLLLTLCQSEVSAVPVCCYFGGGNINSRTPLRGRPLLPQ